MTAALQLGFSRYIISGKNITGYKHDIITYSQEHMSRPKGGVGGPYAPDMYSI